MVLQQPLMISGSQDGTAKLMQIQTKRVLATFSHDRNEATAGTVHEEQSEQATENSVEWFVALAFAIGEYLTAQVRRSTDICVHCLSTARGVNSNSSAGFCNSMQWAATGCLGGFVRIWDLSTYHVCVGYEWWRKPWAECSSHLTTR